MNDGVAGIGIRGLGWWAERHVAAIQKNPRARIVSVCGRDKAKLAARSEALGLSCRICADYQEMLDDPQVDAISICTPNHQHASDTIEAAGVGKHLLIEKPAATSLEDLRRMRDAVRKAGIYTMVGFVLRWNLMFRTIKALVDDGALGRVFMAQADFWQDVGSLDIPMNRWLGRSDEAGSSMLAGGCHAVDGLRWFVGSEVREVTAYSVNGRGLDYDYDPTMLCLLSFDNGAVGKVASTLEPRSPYLMRIELLGTRGSLRNNELFSDKYPGQLDYATIPTAVPGGPELDDPLQDEIDHFIACVTEGRESDLNLEDAVKTHEVCLAADISAREGRPVRLPLI